MREKESFDVYELTMNRHVAENRDNTNPQSGATLKDRGKVYVGGYSSEESNCRAFLNGRDFRTVFGDYHANTKYRTRPAIVKITNKQTGMSIHRIYAAGNIHNGKDKPLALSYHSLIRLIRNKDEFDNLCQVEVSKGCWAAYLWNHPNFVTMVTIRLAVIGLVVSIASILIF